MSGPEARRTLGRNALWNIGVKTAYIVMWVVLTPPVLARLGREQFGFWSLLLLIGGAISFLDLGLTAAMTTYTAQLMAVGERRAVVATLWRALGVYALLGLGVLLGGWLATGWVLDVFHVGAAWRPAAAHAYRLTLVSFGIVCVVAVLQGAMVGLHRMDASNKVGLAVAPLLVVMVLFALRAADPLPALALAQLAQALVTVALLAVVLAGLLRPRPGEPEQRVATGPSVREMLRFGLRVQASALGSFLNMQVDKAMVGATVGLGWITPIELGLRVTNGVSNIPQLFLGALLPAIVDADTRRGGAGRGEMYRTLLTPFVLVLVPIALVTMALADPLLHLWMGSARPDAALALRLLVSSFMVMLFGGVGALIARAGGRPGLEARFGLAALGLHLVLGMLGLRWLGWTGALFGGLAAATLATGWFLFAVDRWLGLAPWRAIAAPLSRALPIGGLALLASAGVLRVIPAGDGRAQQLWPLIAAGTSFALVYASTLWLVAPDESRALRARVLSLRPF